MTLDSFIFKPLAMPLVSTVLPEPNCPKRQIISPGFSFFAIGEKAVEQPSVTPTPVQEEVPQVKEIPELAPEEEISNVWIWVIVAVVIVIAILTGFIVWKKRQ